MIKKFNPSTIAAPAAPYSHGVEVPPNARWLCLAGQVGVAPDGTVPDDARAQADQVWRNIAAILADGGMGLEDLVKITVYVTDRANSEAVREARRAALGDLRPASTLVFVSGLADPKYLLEIEAVAARA